MIPQPVAERAVLCAELGFATANLSVPPGVILPRDGVAVRRWQW